MFQASGPVRASFCRRAREASREPLLSKIQIICTFVAHESVTKNQALGPNKPGSSSMESRVERLFLRIDVNANGRISRSELVNLMATMAGMSHTSATKSADKLFNQAAIGNVKELTFETFHRLFAAEEVGHPRIYKGGRGVLKCGFRRGLCVCCSLVSLEIEKRNVAVT